MALTFTKIPLLIAAMATAITLTSFVPASANTYWASADAETVEVVPANFTVKLKKHKSFKHKTFKHKSYQPRHGHKQHRHFPQRSHKKNHLTKSDLKKQLFFKRVF